MADMTDNARIFQYWEEHWQEFMDLWNSRVKDAADVELVPYDDERHVGCLMVYHWQGVRKVVSVTPETLIEGLAKLNEDLRERCIRAAESAEEAAELAENNAVFAEEQGNRVENLISQINELSELVRTQGEAAERQGVACEAQMNEVKAWYQPFKKAAEDWYLPFKSNAETWLSDTKAAWELWFIERKDIWIGWFRSTVSEWDEWFAACKDAWNRWYRQQTEDWDLWVTSRKADWKDFRETAENTFQGWSREESKRQSAEEIRQELAAHPPLPSERGYWMFWDVDTHEYVESGYSSRGTMDWPEFFWDYETMGIGVSTTRDYSRFFIDEDGRFGMNM